MPCHADPCQDANDGMNSPDHAHALSHADLPSQGHEGEKDSRHSQAPNKGAGNGKGEATAGVD
jgi:hypothetical protein